MKLLCLALRRSVLCSASFFRCGCVRTGLYGVITSLLVIASLALLFPTLRTSRLPCLQGEGSQDEIEARPQLCSCQEPGTVQNNQFPRSKQIVPPTPLFAHTPEVQPCCQCWSFLRLSKPANAPCSWPCSLILVPDLRRGWLVASELSVRPSSSILPWTRTPSLPTSKRGEHSGGR